MKINRLSARSVLHLPKGFHSDGLGLYLRVRSSGSRAWVFRFTDSGKIREIGLGSAYSRTLSEARRLASEMRAAKTLGEEPKEVLRPTNTNKETFRSCAEQLISSKESGWKSKKHSQQWSNTLRDFVYPTIGDLEPKRVHLTHIKTILDPIWFEKTETANRVRQRIEAVLDWAYVHGLRPVENPARWRGILDKIYPAVGKVRPVIHLPSCHYSELPALMAELRGNISGVDSCLRFLILTCARSGEARGARWSEIDLRQRVWKIPGHRMKNRKPHIVPLADDCAELISECNQGDADALVFASPRGSMLSDVALSNRFHDVIDVGTVHGVRASFRSWCAEQTDFNAEICELALAHVNPNKTDAAYQRSDLLEKKSRVNGSMGSFSLKAK